MEQNEDFAYRAVIAGDLQIWEDGTIWRIQNRRWNRWENRVIVQQCKPKRAEHDYGKYLGIRVMIDGKRVYALAHRLVYRHFKGPIPEGLTVNHEDGRKKRNHPDNLTLATDSEQQIHAVRVLGTHPAANQWGIKNPHSTLTTEPVVEIRRRRASGEKLRMIAVDYSVTVQTVSRIARGDRRSHG